MEMVTAGWTLLPCPGKDEMRTARSQQKGETEETSGGRIIRLREKGCILPGQPDVWQSRE